MEYYCVATRRKPIDYEKIKPQTAAVISCGFVCPELCCGWFSRQLTFQNQIKVFTAF